VSDAYTISGDRSWLARHAEAISRALDFYELYADMAGCVHEVPFGNWEDSLLFEGARAFTNLMYLVALRRASDLFYVLGRTEEAHRYETVAQRAYEPIMALIDSQRDTETVALAGLWLPEENRVEMWMTDMVASYPDTMPPNRWPVPPPSACCTTLRIIGQEGYHRDFRWSNVGCLWAAGLLKKGFVKEGEKELARFDSAVGRFGTVHEVYSADDNNPIRHTLYRSETHFSMGIGPYLLALEIKTKLLATSKF